MSALYIFVNLANAWVLLAVVAGAFVAQFIEGIPPCPLCMFQRCAMLLAVLGPCSILIAARREGLTPRAIGTGAGIAILASLLGMAIAVRQILLHILPGDPGYGSAVFGLHLYTWAGVVFFCNILAASFQLLGLHWYSASTPPPARVPGAGMTAAGITAAGLATLLVLNILSVIAESGFAWALPSDPTGYLLFH